jgi:hypothetical protein
VPELYVYLGCVLFMGVRHEKNVESYWHTECNTQGPKYAISSVMGSTRWHQIDRNLTIVDRGDPPYKSFCWFQPIEPLVWHLRKAWSAYFTPGTNITVDEAMAKAQGRSRDITILPGKPIPQSYKIWIAAFHGYVFAFELHSREASSERSKEARPVIPRDMWLESFRATYPDKEDPEEPKGGHRLAETQALIYRFAQQLPRELDFIVYLDNLFVNQPLLAMLRKDLGVAAMQWSQQVKPSQAEAPIWLDLPQNVVGLVWLDLNWLDLHGRQV